MRILVTGGAGFIGSNLCTRLLQEGNEVICVDNFYSSNGSNLSKLKKYPNFTFIEHDISDEVIFTSVDQIYNLACPASPNIYQRDPVYTCKTSAIGAINMLRLAQLSGATLLQASTSEVYGDPLEHPQSEDYWGNVNPYGPRSCYDEGKRFVESLCYSFSSVDTRIARIFNTYGPDMNPVDGRVIPNFIVQALLGKDITIYGDGSQTRSFCYVDNLVDGLIKLMNSDVTEPVNLGCPDEFYIRDVADLVLDITASDSSVVYKILPEDDPVRRCPDITKAMTLLDWYPGLPLVHGLIRTVNYFKEIL